MSQTLLVAVDLAEDHPLEIAFARDMAERMGAHVLLLHVVDYAPTALPIDLPAGYPAPHVDVFREAADRKLAELASRFGDVPVRTMVEVGGAAAEIVSVARREKVDQVIVGGQRRGRLARMFLGSVAARVAHTAPCPVTIVREDARS